MELTPWFGVHEKPVRSGCYETVMRDEDVTQSPPLYSWWDDENKQWSASTGEKENAHLFVCTYGVQDKQWRGVLNEGA